AGADLRICISGVKQHSWAGYGGGSKAILPGVSWINSIDYNHRAVIGVPNRINPTTGVGKIYKNDARDDMNEAARLAQLDFTVQVIYNGSRDVVAVYAGDVVEAHRAACHYAVRHYQTTVLKNADVVICNSYPQNQQAHNNWAIANNSLREGGTVVMVVQSPTGTYPLHYWDERRNFVGRPYWDAPVKRPGFPVKQAGQAIYFSQYLQKRNMNEYDDKFVKFVFSWDEVTALLKQRHGESTKVAVYPYAPLQHEPIELDEV
ncbi:MAG: lactate racemase domain-containing protein, partial [Patescibacteria group bacterium]|nr:lactate racemase domain-containing protein [Patescibacteria group bacterium]